MFRKLMVVIICGICMVFSLPAGVVCAASDGAAEEIVSDKMVEQLFNGKKSAFGNVTAPADFDWRQCEGVTLDFILENNINANILSKVCSKFTEITGINIRIKSVDFTTMIEQINMEFISQVGQIELIYVDPYQTLVRFKDCLEDLNIYEQNPDLPHIVGGLESFMKEQVEICSYFEDEEKLCAIPFDSTTMIMYYRKDIFEKYGEQMKEELGYLPMPGTTSFTWERYIEVARWISENVSEIEYSCVSMSANHNSVYVEFSNILDAYGGTYFKDEGVNTLGIACAAEIYTEDNSFLKALEVYRELVMLGDGAELSLNWQESAELFKEGRVAMMVNWDENAPMMENKSDSEVAGITGYATLPYGSAKSANIYGGSGVGINKFVSEEKKLAAWMFIVWCTSPQVQIQTFLEEGGGNMPTRTNLLHLITGQYMTQLPQAPAVINAQKKNYTYYRPKMRCGYEFERMIQDNLEELVTGAAPEQVRDAITDDWIKLLAGED